MKARYLTQEEGEFYFTQLKEKIEALEHKLEPLTRLICEEKERKKAREAWAYLRGRLSKSTTPARRLLLGLLATAIAVFTFLDQLYHAWERWLAWLHK